MRNSNFFIAALTAGALAGCSTPVEPTPTETTAYNPEQIITLPAERTRIALRSDYGTYVCSDLGRPGENTGVLVADRSSVGAWETFDLVPLEGGRYALIGSDGKYVSADRNKGGMMIANRDNAGDWETFELVALEGGRFAFRTTEGRYATTDLALEGADKGMLFANRDAAGAWESFTLTKVLPAQDQP